MMATAHPDDENNGLLVLLNRGLGYRTALATATRGNGGQNEIGPELFEALGVLRTEELAALHRFDGAEQYFTRAVDFGYTIDLDETLGKWGRDEIIGDYVRLIRTIRPDVITAQNPMATVPASTRITRWRQSCRTRRTRWPAIRRNIPNRSRRGCGRGSRGSFTSRRRAGGGNRRRPRACRRRARRVRFTARQDVLRDWHRGAQHAQVPGAGAAARAARAVGVGTFQLAALRFPARWSPGAALFDGVDTSIAGLARLRRRPPSALRDALHGIADGVQDGAEASSTPRATRRRSRRCWRD